MEKYQIQIIETLILLVVFVAIQYFNNHQINNTLKQFQFQRNRRKVTVKAINLFMALTGVIILTGIWGLQQREMLLFVTSLLTV